MLGQRNRASQAIPCQRKSFSVLPTSACISDTKPAQELDRTSPARCSPSAQLRIGLDLRADSIACCSSVSESVLQTRIAISPSADTVRTDPLNRSPHFSESRFATVQIAHVFRAVAEAPHMALAERDESP